MGHASGEFRGVDIIERATVVDGELNLTSAGMYRPGATWTYMVTDDHFGTEWERIGRFITKDFRRVR